MPDVNKKQRLKCIEEMKKTWKGVGSTLRGEYDPEKQTSSNHEIKIRYQHGGPGAEQIIHEEKVVSSRDGERLKTVTLTTPRAMNGP